MIIAFEGHNASQRGYMAYQVYLHFKKCGYQCTFVRFPSQQLLKLFQTLHLSCDEQHLFLCGQRYIYSNKLKRKHLREKEIVFIDNWIMEGLAFKLAFGSYVEDNLGVNNKIFLPNYTFGYDSLNFLQPDLIIYPRLNNQFIASTPPSYDLPVEKLRQVNVIPYIKDATTPPTEKLLLAYDYVFANNCPATSLITPILFPLDTQRLISVYIQHILGFIQQKTNGGLGRFLALQAPSATSLPSPTHATHAKPQGGITYVEDSFQEQDDIPTHTTFHPDCPECQMASLCQASVMADTVNTPVSPSPHRPKKSTKTPTKKTKNATPKSILVRPKPMKKFVISAPSENTPKG